MSRKRKRKSQRRSRAAVAKRDVSAQRSQKKTSGESETVRGFQPDYSYVVRDLKRIGLLAGGLVAFLIILSFFLR